MSDRVLDVKPRAPNTFPHSSFLASFLRTLYASSCRAAAATVASEATQPRWTSKVRPLSAVRREEGEIHVLAPFVRGSEGERALGSVFVVFVWSAWDPLSLLRPARGTFARSGALKKDLGRRRRNHRGLHNRRRLPGDHWERRARGFLCSRAFIVSHELCWGCPTSSSSSFSSSFSEDK
jgi:hypothetical protein